MNTDLRTAMLASELGFVARLPRTLELDLHADGPLPLTITFCFNPFGELHDVDVDGPIVGTTRPTPIKSKHPPARPSGEEERLRSELTRTQSRVAELELELRLARERIDELEDEASDERAELRQLRTLQKQVRHAIASLQAVVEP